MLAVAIAFWQAIDFNAKGKRRRPWWIFAPVIVFLLLFVLGGCRGSARRPWLSGGGSFPVGRIIGEPPAVFGLHQRR
jgi:hypothetical protein